LNSVAKKPKLIRMEIDKDTQEYFDELEDKIKNIYKIAESARLQGKDPAVEVEARSAGDLIIVIIVILKFKEFQSHEILMNLNVFRDDG